MNPSPESDDDGWDGGGTYAVRICGATLVGPSGVVGRGRSDESFVAVYPNHKSAQECADSAVAPLLPPTRKDPAGAAAAAAFVHHPQLVAIQRRETARLLAAELPLIDRVSLEAETNRLADVYLLAFEREADRVIPSYDIEFE